MIPTTTNPAEAAAEAGLRYVSDAKPGIRRENSKGGFRYIGPDGNEVTDAVHLARIRGLAIPPAWADVWICPISNGHLQAVGRDAKGRKQYRYHKKWRETRDETKYFRSIAFAHALPKIRKQVELDLSKPGMPREKVLATVVKLLETTLIRIGNEEYAKQNNSYGLTTLRNKHVRVEGSSIHFEFKGKSGKKHFIDVKDRKLASIVKKARDLPGQELFEYVGEDGELHNVNSSDVNAYLKEISGEEFTAKDFRTWAGTVLAANILLESTEGESAGPTKKNVVAAIESVAKKLGNTPSICRKCYVNPAVVDSYLDGSLIRLMRRKSQLKRRGIAAELLPEEAAVLGVLEDLVQSKMEDRAPQVRRKAG